MENPEIYGNDGRNRLSRGQRLIAAENFAYWQLSTLLTPSSLMSWRLIAAKTIGFFTLPRPKQQRFTRLAAYRRGKPKPKRCGCSVVASGLHEAAAYRRGENTRGACGAGALVMLQ
ncbi:MAG: hypothetical protein KF778_06120 [Rhodocyclaceae bacterium]|nr:hypothetical protein [Rhodocyclaceae bacterium]